MKNLLLSEIIKNKDATELAEKYVKEKANEDEIIIFGCSSTGKLVLEELRKLAITPLCFSDDVEYVNFSEYDGIPVFSMKETAEKYEKKDNISIVLCVNHSDQNWDVKQKLISHGFRKYIDKDLILFMQKKRNLLKYGIQDKLNIDDKQDTVLIAMDKIECNITARCTLKCKDCAQLLYMTEPLGHSDVNLTIKTVKEFAKTVDYCALVEVFGGEPLMHPDLVAILDEVSSHSNLLEVVVDTNGTLMPREELLSLMGNRRIAMRVTDYGEVSTQKKNIVEQCKKYNIPCTVKKVGQWNIYGPAEETVNQNNQEKYESCVSANKCSSLIEGKWHICARDAHLTRTGKLEDNRSEYIDFMDIKTGITANRQKMMKLLNRKECLSACVYCEGSNNLAMGGVQVTRK